MDPKQIRKQLQSQSPRSTRQKSAIQNLYKQLQEPIAQETLIHHYVRAIQDTEQVANQLAIKLRELITEYAPEWTNAIEDHKAFSHSLLQKSKNTILKELKIEQTAGGQLPKQDIEYLKTLAQNVIDLHKTKDSYQDRLKELLQAYCPNTLALTSTMICGKLIVQAKTIQRLSTLPGSSIQILGAEKALFRHLKTKATSPKYGFLYAHPDIQKAKKSFRGKLARSLANKIAIASKVDITKSSTTFGQKTMKELLKHWKKQGWLQ